jgi:hypothetical protein
VEFNFNTKNSTTQAPITLAGSPVVKVYKGNATTSEVTTGVTLTVDFDGITGLHHVTIVTTDAFYAAENSYSVILTAGTVDSISVAGQRLFTFAIRQVPGVVLSGTLQTGNTSTSVVLPSTASSTTDFYKGDIVEVISGTGAGQARTIITGYNGTTKVAPLDSNEPWITTPDTTSVVRVWSNPLGGTDASMAIAVWGALRSANTAAGSFGEGVVVNSFIANAITAAAINADAITDAKVAADVTIASVTGAVGSVTGAVGSVTGNVSGNVVGSVGSVTTVSDKTGYRLSSTGVADILTTALTESYAADGAAGTLSQILFGLQAFLQERTISGTTMTIKKLDGSTTAFVITTNDATIPTSYTRSS